MALSVVDGSAQVGLDQALSDLMDECPRLADLKPRSEAQPGLGEGKG